MSQAAVGPDGSNFPARRYCMFYKLMVASILQDKAGTLLLETFVVCSFLLFHWLQRKGKGKLFYYYSTTVWGGVKILLSSDKITVQESVKLKKELEMLTANVCAVFRLTYQKSFVNKYGNELSSIATLTVPCGRICLMELQKVNKLWFHKGWHEFVECYSIGVGYFLVFMYEGKSTSNFNVHMFDMTVSEIKNPYVDEHESLGNQKVKLKPARAKITSETLTRRWRAVTPEEKVRTIRAAHMFRSYNPFLQVILRPSYVYSGFLLYVALGFAEKYLNQVSERIKLQVSDGREWPLRASKCERKLSKGWNRFHKENDLKEGK
ncbi:hypothetical protein POTOM_033289 [Populus tomentosa]|uniref:TF-B3 domain-containing protein n=1 Tax=Populus tomentosa TaxID=118781 RepID=A0A8X8CRA3_POPTO|nr:hypothetical protein POTOM_033289 [Populus tomentosa]